jgi:hypothetical protein
MAIRTSPTLTVLPYATTLFFSRGVHANDVISKQRDLDDFLYMKSDYRCVLLSYIMILQVTKPIFADEPFWNFADLVVRQNRVERDKI